MRWYRWVYAADGAVFVIGILFFLIGQPGQGVLSILLALLGFWQVRVVSGGMRTRLSPRVVVAAKHGPLLALLLLGTIWIVAIGIGYIIRGELGSGSSRIALALLLALAFLFVLRRALRDYG